MLARGPAHMVCWPYGQRYAERRDTTGTDAERSPVPRHRPAHRRRWLDAGVGGWTLATTSFLPPFSASRMGEATWRRSLSPSEGSSIEITGSQSRAESIRNEGILVATARQSVAGNPFKAQRLAGDYLLAIQRLDPRRHNTRNGHGLGLSIVRAIARAHRATLIAQPQADGGLSISITFPAPTKTSAGSDHGAFMEQSGRNGRQQPASADPTHPA